MVFNRILLSIFLLVGFSVLEAAETATTIAKAVAPRALSQSSGGAQSTTATPSLSPQSANAGPNVVNQAGAFTYSYPIRIPEGTNGVQPNVSLAYNSAAGNGMLGMGFSLSGLSAITRDSSYPINFDGNDRFALDGQKLFLKTASKTWHPENETYDLIKAYISTSETTNPSSLNSYWVVQKKDGSKLYYGATPDSFVTAVGKNGQARVWALNKVEDPNGNFYTITYLQDSGASYPLRIVYTQNTAAGISKFKTVQFSYEARTDIGVLYLPTAVNTGNRLKWISVLIGTDAGGAGGSLVRKYRFDYDLSTGTGRSRLSQVQEYGNNGTSTLPPTSFSWLYQATSLAGAPVTTSRAGDYGNNIWGSTFADVNGDGKADWLNFASTSSGSSVDVSLSSGNGLFQAAQRTNLTGDRGVWFSSFADINGDGKVDWMNFAATTSGLSVDVCLSLGNGLFQAAQRTNRTGDYGGNRWFSSFADINGDGKADWINYASTSQGSSADVSLSIGNGLFNSPQRTSRAGDYGNNNVWRSAFADVNGDGRADWLNFASTSSGSSVDVSLSSGNGLFQAAQRTNLSGDRGVWFNSFADINGDGKADWMNFAATTSGLSVDVCLSMGNGLFQAAQRTNRTGDYGGNSWFSSFADINGDGRADWINSASTPQGSSAVVSMSTGNGLFSSPQNTSKAGDYGNNIWGSQFADINGDGKADWINYASTSSGSSAAVVFAPGPANDLLSGITLPTGGTITASYTPAPQVSGAIVPANSQTAAGVSKWSIANSSSRQLVTTSRVSDGLGGGNDIITNYIYVNGLIQTGASADRKDLGFETVEKTDVGSQTITVSRYNQILPTAGKPASLLAGYPASILVKDTSGNKYSEVLYTYESRSGAVANVNFVAQTGVLNKVYEGTQTPVNIRSKSTSITNYDTYGNLLSSTNLGLVDNQGNDISPSDNVTESFVYAQSSSRYLFRLASKKIESFDATLQLGTLSKTTYYYDGSTQENYVGSGLLTQVANYVDDTNFVTQALGYESVYQNLGIANRFTDARGAVSRKSYDTNYYSAVVSSSDPAGNIVTFGYDSLMQATTVTDVNLNISSKTYDVFGRVLKEISPVDSLTNPGTEYIYNDTANLPSSPSSVKVRTKGSGTTYLESYKYVDGLGRPVQTLSQNILGSWAATDLYYDGQGRNNQVSNPYQVTSTAFNRAGTLKTIFYFDAVGRNVRVDHPNGARRLTIYTPKTVTQVDEENHVTDTVQDGNTVTQHSYSGVYPTQTLYSTTTAQAFRGLSKMADNEDNLISTRYDMLGRKTQYTDPDQGIWTYQYDSNGNVTSQTDSRGNITTFAYDILNRPTQKSINGVLGVTYYYDESGHGYSRGQLTRVVQDLSTDSFTYDILGRATQSARTVTGYGTKTRAFSYNSGGQLQSQTLPDGETLNYSYTNEGYVRTIVGNANYLLNAQEDFLGRINNVQYGNNVSTTFQFDPTTLHTIRISAGSIMSFAYTYDKVGNVLTKTDQLNYANNESYTYDFLDRLSTATGVYGTKNYVYNQINNLLGMTGTVANTYSATQPHALTGDGVFGYAYDSAGNMTSKISGGTPVATYVYDERNRLTSVTMDANSSQYAYDHARQRIKKTDVTPTTNKTTIFWFDDYEETYDNNAGGALIETTKSYYANGKKIAQRTSSDSTLVFLYQDHLGSTSVVSDNSGVVISRLQYEPYGKLASANNGKVTELFTGQDWDANVELYYYNARFYNPAIGRFIQTDPAVCDVGFAVKLSLAERMNPFMYCGNNPVVYTDPSGLWFGIDDAWYFLSGAVSAGIAKAAAGGNFFEVVGTALAGGAAGWVAGNASVIAGAIGGAILDANGLGLVLPGFAGGAAVGFLMGFAAPIGVGASLGSGAYDNSFENLVIDCTVNSVGAGFGGVNVLTMEIQNIFAPGTNKIDYESTRQHGVLTYETDDSSGARNMSGSGAGGGFALGNVAISWNKETWLKRRPADGAKFYAETKRHETQHVRQQRRMGAQASFDLIFESLFHGGNNVYRTPYLLGLEYDAQQGQDDPY